MRFRCSLLILLVCELLVTMVAWQPVISGDTDEQWVPPEGLADGWYARIETSMGRIVARLLPEQAPQAVAYFAGLAEARLEWFDMASGELRKSHYYDGIKVHLADAGQRFEAGDPRGTGDGAPEIFIPHEGFGPIDFSKPGRLGMTRGVGRISGVMFFATASGHGWLNGRHPCFGEVVSGNNVILRISMVKTYSNGRPIDPPVIEQIRIFSVGKPDPLPEPEPYNPERPEFREKDELRLRP